MWRWCTSCGGSDALALVAARVALCLWCREELGGLRREPTARHPGLYRYEGSLRRLVLRAKAEGDGAAMRLLLHLFRTHPRARVSRDALVVPCPSSLWSRLRGRHDIAAMLAESIHASHGATVLPAPWALHWRLRKRALQDERRADDPLPRSGALQRLWLRRRATAVRGRAVLIVDDVVTTGHTLQSVRSALAAAEPREVRTLTLAQARFD